MSYEHDAPPKAAYKTLGEQARDLAMHDPELVRHIILRSFQILETNISSANRAHFAEQVVDRIARGT